MFHAIPLAVGLLMVPLSVPVAAAPDTATLDTSAPDTAAPDTPAPIPPEPPPTMTPPQWWHDYQFGDYLSFAGTWEEETDGTDVHGLQVSFGLEGKVKNIVGKADTWLSYRHGGDLEVYGLGVQLTAIPFIRKSAGLGFGMNHGLEYRTESPHEGFGGFLGPGVQGIFWLGKHVQLNVGIEHDFGIGTRSRDVLHFSIGFGHRYWPPKIPKGVPIDDAPAPKE